jgi:hypothetical protein
MTDEQVEFKGSEQEKAELLAALARNCACSPDLYATRQCCAAHAMLLDQRTLDRLLFARHLETQLVSEEFRGRA